MTSTTLTPQASPKKDDDLAEILRRLTDAKPDAKALQKASKTTDTVAVTRTALAALESLSGLLKTVAVHSERREATPVERADMMKLAKTAKDVVPAVNAAVDAVKQAIFNHFDVELEANADVTGLAIDADGHYLVRDEVYVPEADLRFTRELQENAAHVTAENLRKAWYDGAITRRDYMESTEHVDVPREVVDKLLAAKLKAKPELLIKLKPYVTPGKVFSKFWVRPPKKDES